MFQMQIQNSKDKNILSGYVTSIFRAEMSNCHISDQNVTMDCNIPEYNIISNAIRVLRGFPPK